MKLKLRVIMLSFMVPSGVIVCSESFTSWVLEGVMSWEGLKLGGVSLVKESSILLCGEPAMLDLVIIRLPAFMISPLRLLRFLFARTRF